MLRNCYGEVFMHAILFRELAFICSGLVSDGKGLTIDNDPL